MIFLVEKSFSSSVAFTDTHSIRPDAAEIIFPSYSVIPSKETGRRRGLLECSQMIKHYLNDGFGSTHSIRGGTGGSEKKSVDSGSSCEPRADEEPIQS